MRDDITFGQLRTFVCAAKLGSFIKAADQLGISQPAVSDQIATLEARLKQTLFQRRRGTTPTLTQNGQNVLQVAESILQASENLFAKTEETTQRERVRISIGTYLLQAYLNPLIGEIHRKFPNVEIDLQPIVSYEEAVARMQKGELDMTIYTLSTTGHSFPEGVKVCDAPVAFVVSAELFEDLESGTRTREELDYIVPIKRDARTVRWVNEMFRETGIVPARPPRLIDNAELVTRMAKEGLGAAYLMPESIMADLAAGRLRVLDIPLTPMTRIIAVNPGHSEAIGFIAAELRQRFLRDAGKIAELMRGSE